LDRTKQFAIDYILQTDYKQIEEVSLYNLRLKGKNFRSAILFTLARAIHANHVDVVGAKKGDPILDFNNTTQYDKVVALAASIEIAHNSSLLQDDIIDKADSRRNQTAAHKVYGPSTSVFASDFMISRASRMLTYSFDNCHISQLFSTAIYNLVYGELIQAGRNFSTNNLIESGEVKLIDYQNYFESYIAKTYYKTASMISLGCRGLGIIFNLDIENQRRLFNFGAHLGIAF
tara:strand:- start:408 stop:1103 length:696 start_codon:yes stop_codon:yes gene_type:complete